MSAVAIGNSLENARVYASAVRAVRSAPAAPAIDVVATVARAAQTPSISEQGLGLAALSASFDPTARVSNELAVADAKLAQIGDLVASDGSTPAGVDEIARSAKFANRPLLDGTYTAAVNGHSLAIPSFMARDAADGVQDRVRKTRQEIDSFRANAIDRAAFAARAMAEELLGDTPLTMDASGAKSAALLIRAKTLVDPRSVAESGTGRAENVLALIR